MNPLKSFSYFERCIGDCSVVGIISTSQSPQDKTCLIPLQAGKTAPERERSLCPCQMIETKSFAGGFWSYK